MKKILIIFIFTILVVGFGYFVFNFFQPEIAKAGSEHNVSGWAWSENIGWISFNNTSGGGTASYGVNINQTTGNFSGYAWSENIGWIKFDPDVSGAPDPSLGSVKLNLSSYKITGWARALAYGDDWDGWIRFDYGPNGSYLDANGDFRGWAWGGDVVGWISLNNADTGGNLYKVQTFPPSYVLTVSKAGAGTGSGTVTATVGTGDGINCGTNCTESYVSGASVTLTPFSSSDSFFVGWSGDADCSDGNVTMNAPKNCIATFNLLPPDFILNSSNAIHITLIIGSPSQTSGSTTITVIPANGFNSNVGLSVQSVSPGLSGATYNFSNPTLIPSKYSSGSTFSVTLPSTTLAGIYAITIKGEGSGLVRTVDVRLNVEVFDPGWQEI